MLGGYNRFAAPNYRLVWGMDARTFRNGNPSAMKYMNPRDSGLGWACFVLERFAEVGFYNKVEWETERFGPDEAGTDKRIDYLGPYPNRGCYISIAMLIDDGGDDSGDAWTLEMVKLSSGLLEEIKRRVTYGAQNDHSLATLALKQEKKRALDAAKVEKLAGDLKEWYQQNEEKINTRHTRKWSNLTGAKPLPQPQTFQSLTLT